MPSAPGWATRGVATSGVGTTEATFAVPTGVVDGDILIAALAHKGGAYGTWPAGWTLVDRALSVATRGEVYWRRASSEPGSYTVTGLGTSATVACRAYTGGLASGDVVEGYEILAVAAGSGTGAPNLTTTDPNLLLLHITMAGDNTNLSTTFVRSGLAAPFNAGPDPQVTTQPNFLNVGTATGGGTRVGVAHWMKTIPGDTGEAFTVVITAAHVSMWLALIPETAAATAGTRYYLSTKYPAAHLYGPIRGDWDSQIFSPRATEIQGYIWELSQLRSDAGYLVETDELVNTLDEQALLFYRWVTPPLDAQGISGTFDLLMYCSGFWVGGVQTPDTPSSSTVVFRVHVYITVGDTTAVRATLLDRYLDPTPLLNDGTARFQALTSPQALAGANALAGDRIMVEMGFYILDSPLPPPHLPPDEWTIIFTQRGTFSPLLGGFTGDRGISNVDGAVGDPNGLHVPYFEFSQTLVEQTYAGTPPTNLSCATADPITLGDTLGPFDTTHLASLGRDVWFNWTAPATQRVFLHCFGTYYRVFLNIYEGADCASLTQTSSIPDAASQHTFTSRTVQILDATMGTTYWFRLRSFPGFNDHAPSSGGSLLFSLIPYQAPQENDLVLPTAGYLLVYRETTLISMSVAFEGLAVSGVAIDATLRPMDDLNGGTHTAARLLLALFFEETLIEILDLATLNVGETEIDFMYDPFTGGVTTRTASLAIDPAGTLAIGHFGDGFRLAAAEGASWQDRVSTAAPGAILLIDATHGDSQAAAPWPAATSRFPTLEAGGTNYLEYALDGSLAYYVSTDWYVPTVAGGHTVFRYDLGAGSQLGAFGIVPGSTGHTPSLKGLFPLPDGGLLACNGDHVVRLNAAGAVIQTYTPSDPDRSHSLADIEITADAVAFWVLDEESTTLWKFNIDTGAELADVWTLCGVGSCTSIVLYRPEGITPPTPPVLPSACPVSITPDLSSALCTGPAPIMP